MRGAIRRGLVLAFSLVAVSTDAALASPYQPLVGIVHVHSTASTGMLSLEEIALQAERSGIDVVLLAENYGLRFAYNLLPLPGLLQVSRSFPSLTPTTIAEYLQTVEETNRRHPQVMLIPGVETVPHYFWTGSLWRGDLTMHDGQKNLLVVGLNRTEDYQRLPIIGNPGAARYNARSLIRAVPLLVVVAGLGLLTRQRERWYQIGGFLVSQRRRPWRLSASFILIGIVWSAYNAPFTVPPFPTDRSDAGLAPYQALIDYVNQRGGMTIWSYPEAKDFHVHTYPLAKRFVLKYVTKTDPHPEVLLTTHRYTAFGALYQDHTTAEQPGRMWDQVLERYCRGEGERPVWGVGELGFHGDGIKGLSDVLSVFYVRKRTAKEALAALRAGRTYATIPGEYSNQLVVRTFALTDGAREAFMGETLVVPHGGSVTLRLALEAQDGTARSFQAVLVRNGKPWRHLEGTTPFAFALDDTPPPDRACTYYRLWMRKPHALVTNPLFAAPSREIKD